MYKPVRAAPVKGPLFGGPRSCTVLTGSQGSRGGSLTTPAVHFLRLHNYIRMQSTSYLYATPEAHRTCTPAVMQSCGRCCGTLKPTAVCYGREQIPKEKGFTVTVTTATARTSLGTPLQQPLNHRDGYGAGCSHVPGASTVSPVPHLVAICALHVTVSVPAARALDRPGGQPTGLVADERL